MRKGLVVAVLVLTWPTAGAEANEYGGGSPPATPGDTPTQLSLVGIRLVTPDTFRVSVNVGTRCYAVRGVRNTRVAPDGTFSLDYRVRGRLRDIPGSQSTRIRVSGQVAGTGGTGTVTVNARLRRNGRIVERCNPAARAWQVRVRSATPRLAGPVQPDASYFGTTGQRQGPRVRPFVLRVDPRGRRVRTASFEYAQRCGRGTWQWENITPGGRITDDEFHLRETFRYRWADGMERYRVRVDGVFDGGGVTGTLSVTSVFRSPSGAVKDRCRTGRVAFDAAL